MFTEPLKNEKEEAETGENTKKIEKQEQELPFMFLNLDVPDMPLFQDDVQEKGILPQIAINDLLKKYDGETETNTTVGGVAVSRRYRLLETPAFLILNYDRFEKIIKKGKDANQEPEKKKVLATFPLSGLMIPVQDKQGNEVKTEIYDLVANIVHVSGTRFLVHVPGPSTEDKKGVCWYEIDELGVKVMNVHDILLSETSLQIWKRR